MGGAYAMTLRIVQLGSPRHAGEGLRIGTVRRPPRGVSKERHATDDWYDVWLPELAPSARLVKKAQTAASPAEWRAFERGYRAEMTRPEARRLLELLAALSKRTNLSVGCYCDDASKCHRSVLRDLLAERDADFAE